MAEAKHTPGPWNIISDRHGTFIRGTDGSLINHMYHFNVTDSLMQGYTQAQRDERTQADAHLIAASPEMYALLAEINWVFYVTGTTKAMREVMAKTKPLLKKARGE